jgi:hypothetical protein
LLTDGNGKSKHVPYCVAKQLWFLFLPQLSSSSLSVCECLCQPLSPAHTHPPTAPNIFHFSQNGSLASLALSSHTHTQTQSHRRAHKYTHRHRTRRKVRAKGGTRWRFRLLHQMEIQSWWGSENRPEFLTVHILWKCESVKRYFFSYTSSHCCCCCYFSILSLSLFSLFSFFCALGDIIWKNLIILFLYIRSLAYLSVTKSVYFFIMF